MRTVQTPISVKVATRAAAAVNQATRIGSDSCKGSPLFCTISLVRSAGFPDWDVRGFASVCKDQEIFSFIHNLNRRIYRRIRGLLHTPHSLSKNFTPGLQQPRLTLRVLLPPVQRGGINTRRFGSLVPGRMLQQSQDGRIPPAFAGALR